MNELIENEDIITIINDIKKDILFTRNKIMYNANNELIHLYFRIGKIISEKASYGRKFVELLSHKLKVDFPNSTGFSSRNLRRMKAFYEEYKSFSILPPAVADLPWTHNYILIEKIKNLNERFWYANECIRNGWSKTFLMHQIELNLFDRSITAKKMTNFESKLLIKDNSKIANEIIKDPYIFELEGLNDDYIEKELENKMLERIKNILLELGKGFSFVGNQYKISSDNNDYYIDLLFYHLELHCYIVVELKTTEFKPEYIGQLGFYVKAIDNTVRKESDNQTIGLLLCKDKDKISVEWALDIINVPIGVTSYKIINKNDIFSKLPSEEDINKFF